MSVGKDINVPSKDLISRQGMLNSLNKHRIAKMIEGKDVTLVWECIDKVLQEPSAQAERRWIPCSERLPKDDRCVLITCEWDDVEIGWYDGEWRSEHCVYDDSDIVAWMPLPEPYAERRTDG